jgi:hypothetical protein
LFKGSFKDPRFCSLGFLCVSRFMNECIDSTMGRIPVCLLCCLIVTIRGLVGSFNIVMKTILFLCIDVYILFSTGVFSSVDSPSLSLGDQSKVSGGCPEGERGSSLFRVTCKFIMNQ